MPKSKTFLWYSLGEQVCAVCAPYQCQDGSILIADVPQSAATFSAMEPFELQHLQFVLIKL